MLVDAAPRLQACIDATAVDGVVDVPPGAYAIGTQLHVTRPLTLQTPGTGACPLDGAGCAVFVATPSFATELGMIVVPASGAHVRRLVLDGNRASRMGAAVDACHAGNNTRGFNGALQCSHCSLTESVSKNALCGSGLVVAGPGTEISVRDNLFAMNGRHKGLFSDGLTVLEAECAEFIGNRFLDNTDVDFIFGGCVGCKIQSNTITHTGDPDGGSFAALMIQKWPNTSGNYDSADVAGNQIDCGPNRDCGSGIYVGSESWYPGTPFGSNAPDQVSGSIHDNNVVNAKNGLYIAARGFSIFHNGVFNAHNGGVPSSCGRLLDNSTPYIVSPTSQVIDFRGENVDPMFHVHFSSVSWANCIPNWPF